MDKFYITMDFGEIKGAFSKSRHDIEIVLNRNGYKSIPIDNPDKKKCKIPFLTEMICGLKSWIYIIRTIPTGSILFFQHPMSFSIVSYFMIPILKVVKKTKVICIIHDIYSLRDKQNKHKMYYYIKDIGLLNRSDQVICHNDKMKNKLIEKGVKNSILVSLEIFDYILEDSQVNCPKKFPIEIGVMIAGNLSGEKANYINKLNELSSEINILLYGPNFNEKLYNESKNIKYYGVFKPEELPEVLSGNYGLIWDGDSITECSGNIGEYLMINNPHKTSLFLASGYPVIVWKKAALAEFVNRNGVGIAIESLYDLKLLKNITQDKYKDMLTNVKKIGGMIRKGLFFEKALLTAEKNLRSK